jgi:cytochrome c-type biogenesis protein CcsB|tara:strand:+ start:761 stop:1750 length:990 start_codon:yes stop_codon:yes gene_type:complete
MMDIQSFLDNLVFLSLLVVTILYWASLVFTNFKILGKLSFYGTVFANFSIFSLLGLRWLTFGYFPLSNLYESLLFLAWGITFITLIIEDRANLSLVGSISTPSALFISGFAGLSLPESMQAPSPLVPALKSNWLMMHVTVMMLSYAALIVGSLLAIFFLVLANGKNEKITLQGNSYGLTPTAVNNDAKPDAKLTAYYREGNSLESYPNLLVTDGNSENTNTARLSLLESVDNLSYRTISFGFPLLTVGIIAGAVWANEAWGSYWSWDPKETWALITWLVFASYLHARITKSWQGQKPAMIASVGFIVVWICYLGVNFLGKGLHTYGQML